MPTLYHIDFQWAYSLPKTQEIEPTFNRLGNWARFSNLSWYLWSNYSAVEIYNFLKVHTFVTGTGIEDFVVVTALQPENHFGYAPAWFWNWYQNVRERDPTADVLSFLLNPPTKKP